MRILIFTTQDRFFLSHIKERAIFFKNQGCIVGVAAQKTSDEFVCEIESLGFSFFDTKIERQSVNPFLALAHLARLFLIYTRFKPDISYNLGAKAIFYGTFIARLCDPSVGVVNAPIGLGFVFASDSVKAKCLKPLVLLLYRLFLNPSKLFSALTTYFLGLYIFLLINFEKTRFINVNENINTSFTTYKMLSDKDIP